MLSGLLWGLRFSSVFEVLCRCFLESSRGFLRSKIFVISEGFLLVFSGFFWGLGRCSGLTREKKL